MIFTKKNKNFKRAFSLIELSVVLVIISILITGVLSASVVAVNNARYKNTHEKIEELYQALGNYLKVNGKLPCPAALNIAKGSANYATEAGTNGACTNDLVANEVSHGMVPAVTLGLSPDFAEDAFGSKIYYVVDEDLTSASTFDDDIRDNGPTGYTTQLTINQDPAATSFEADVLLLSHGANKYGAYSANATTKIGSDGGTHEDDNDSSSANGDFYSTSNQDEFDDVLFAKQITNMIADFNAYDKINCASDSESLYGTTISWSEANYSEEKVADTNCPSGYTSGPTNPTRNCGSFGEWVTIVRPCVAP